MPNLYRQAVRFIKSAKEQRSPQLSFYSDPGNSGLIMYPRGVIDRTADFNPWNDYARNTSLLMQKDYSDGDYGIRSGNVQGEWKDIGDDPFIDVSLENPDSKLNDSFRQYIGVDFSDPRIQGLGSNPYIYSFDNNRSTSATTCSVNWKPRQLSPAAVRDAINILAHENAHLRSLKDMNIYTDTSWDNKIANDSPGDQLSRATLPWQGAFSTEWPAVVNEWTYGQPGGTIHPIMLRGFRGSKPMRSFNSGYLTSDLYYDDMFPLVRTRQLKSEPGREYRYWHAPGEPDKPSGSLKRIVYDTPSGWWVSPSGKWERTGGDVFDPKYYFKDNMNIVNLPPALQRHIHNMSFLNYGQPTPVRNTASLSLRNQVQDLFAPLALRSRFRHSGDKTYAQLISDTYKALGDADRREGGSGCMQFWTDAIANNQLGKKYAWGDYITLGDMDTWLHENPMWDPNMTLQPIPIGLAELQKKYSLSPTVDSAADWRDVKQYKAIKRDAQHCYDLQNELDTYGPKDGGMGA